MARAASAPLKVVQSRRNDTKAARHRYRPAKHVLPIPDPPSSVVRRGRSIPPGTNMVAETEVKGVTGVAVKDSRAQVTISSPE
jgi:hypothetical protein